MAGGLLQIVAKGAQDLYLTGNPKLSFFKKVFKTHTNFACESIKLNMNRNTMNVDQKTNLICKIDRNADMLSNMYFGLTIPNIPKFSGEKFKFVQNLGEVLIDNYYITIGGNIVDKHYGEWVHIWNELSLTSNKAYGYSRLIGNVADIYAPDDYSKKYNEDEIQVFERKIYVPLQFWFNKQPGLALPLIGLQYHSIEIHIELRPLTDVFTVGLSKTATQEATTDKPTLHDCEKYFNVNNNSINIDPFIETNYIFLDTTERTFFAKNSQEYLIEQVSRLTFDGLNNNNMLNLDIHNPVKELVWVFSRNDRFKENKWFEFTDWETRKANTTIRPKMTDTEIYTDSAMNGEIMKTSKLLFNGLDRIESKDTYYYNIIQPYQHHSFLPKPGVYVYSFSLNPELFQPSGSCNMSKINKVQMYTECNEPLDESYKYDLTLYSVNYNFLKIQSGLAGVVYA